MKIYTNYIIKNLILVISIISIILVSIIWLTQSLRYLNLIINSGISFFSFFKLSLLIIPSLAYIILPIATFIGIIFFYNKLTLERELIILQNAGLSKFNIYKPAFITSIIFVILHFILSAYIMPLSSREFRQKLFYYKNNYGNLLLEEGVFNNKIKGLTIYIEQQSSDGFIKNIFINDIRDSKKNITIMAEYGKLTRNDNTTIFKLFNGNKQETDENGKFSILYFEDFSYKLDLVKATNNKFNYELNEHYLNELLRLKDNNQSFSFKILVELHQRLTWPLYNLVLTLFALLIIDINQTNIRGSKINFFLSASFSITSVLLYFIFFNLANKFPSFIILIYLKIFLYITISSYFLLYLHNLKDICKNKKLI